MTEHKQVEVSQEEYVWLKQHNVPETALPHPFVSTWYIMQKVTSDANGELGDFIEHCSEKSELNLLSAIIYGYKLKESEKYYLVAAETKEQQETLNGGTYNDNHYKFAYLSGS